MRSDLSYTRDDLVKIWTHFIILPVCEWKFGPIFLRTTFQYSYFNTTEVVSRNQPLKFLFDTEYLLVVFISHCKHEGLHRVPSNGIRLQLQDDLQKNEEIRVCRYIIILYKQRHIYFWKKIHLYIFVQIYSKSSNFSSTKAVFQWNLCIQIFWKSEHYKILFAQVVEKV